MPTTTLTLGAVEFVGTPNAVEQIVGDPPQWSDGSDATYAYVAKGGTTGPSAGGAFAPVTVPVDGTLESLRFFLRAKAEPGYGPNPAMFGPDLVDGGDGFADTVDNLILPHDGNIYEAWLNGTVYPENNPDGWLASPNLQVVCDVLTTFSRIYIYEVRVEVTTADEVIRVTRQFPRDDAYGLGSAPRIFPPPRGGRLVGGYM